MKFTGYLSFLRSSVPTDLGVRCGGHIAFREGGTTDSLRLSHIIVMGNLT